MINELDDKLVGKKFKKVHMKLYEEINNSSFELLFGHINIEIFDIVQVKTYNQVIFPVIQHLANDFNR